MASRNHKNTGVVHITVLLALTGRVIGNMIWSLYPFAPARPRIWLHQLLQPPEPVPRPAVRPGFLRGQEPGLCFLPVSPECPDMWEGAEVAMWEPAIHGPGQGMAAGPRAGPAPGL